jgi:glycosyltransferase involved in cell wall biosynthesis
MTPRVSVCLPAYNCSPYVVEAIESVLEQTYADFEFIIIDDCSTDDSRDIIGRYASRDGRIRFLENVQNAGMVRNWNRCLQEARGEYVKFLCGDDRLAARDTLGRMIAVMDADRSLSLVASSRYVIDERSRVVKQLSRYGSRDIVMSGAEVIRDCLLEQRNLIGEPSVVLFRRSQAGRGFDTRYRQFVDLEMWFHLLEQGNMAYLQEPLSSFRVHDRQATAANNIDGHVQIDEQILLVREYAARPYLRLSPLDHAYMRFIPARNIWRLYRRHGKLTREAAWERINGLYDGDRSAFYLFFPVHRLIRSYEGLARRLMLVTRKRLCR